MVSSLTNLKDVGPAGYRPLQSDDLFISDPVNCHCDGLHCDSGRPALRGRQPGWPTGSTSESQQGLVTVALARH